MSILQTYFLEPTQANYIKVINSFTEELMLTPYSVELTNKMAEFFFRTQNYSLANYYFNRSLQINGNQPEIRNNSSFILLNYGITEAKEIDEAFKKISIKAFKIGSKRILSSYTRVLC